jgi:hypothetical protein
MAGADAAQLALYCLPGMQPKFQFQRMFVVVYGLHIL